LNANDVDYLGLGDDAPTEVKKPRKPKIFDVGNIIPARSIQKIVCGGMHTLALASNGTVWSWGCNDDGALGRQGSEKNPMQVDSSLQIPVTDIVAGDCHSIAYNTDKNQIFYWGCYRVSQSYTICFSSLKAKEKLLTSALTTNLSILFHKLLYILEA